MNLVYVATLLAVCSAAKLDHTYLPPPSAKTAGGISGDIQTPRVQNSFSPSRSGLPKGSFDNDFEGVVVEASPGIRTNPEETGLGASRASYGSTHSKVGAAAFTTANQQEFQTESNVQNTQSSHNDQLEFQTFQNSQQGPHSDFNKPSIRPQSGLDRASNIVRYHSEIGPETYHYGYETDNGITVEENGVTINGVQAEGLFSYTGDDGKFYKVTYTAGEKGFRPMGDHLPTPPPIPDEILRSLEQNAKDEAAGLIDDGSYDAAKYNTGDDYTKSDSSNTRYNGIQSGFGNKPETNAATVETFVHQNNQAPGSLNVKDQFISNDSTQTVTGFVPENQQSNIGENKPIKNQSSFMQLGFPESNNKTNYYMNTQIDEISSVDDYSRPIYFGPAQFNLASNNDLNKSYLPPNNDQLNLGNTQRMSDSGFRKSSYADRNLHQQLVGLQSMFQTSPINNMNQYTQTSNNVASIQNQNQFMKDFPNNLNINSDVQYQKQKHFNSNTFNNPLPTSQPQTELTIPFEDSPNSNKGNNLQSQEHFENQQINQMISGTPTQASFSTLSTPDYQTYNVKKTISVHGGSNNNDNTQFNPNVVQQSQYQDSDLSYYYNQPSKSFNTPIQFHTPPTLISENGNYMDNFKNSNTRQNNNFQDSTMYPIPPMRAYNVTSSIPSTIQNNSKFSSQYTGITQASISPFPAIAQPMENLDSFNTKMQTNTQISNQDFVQSISGQVMPGFNRIGFIPKPNQQYDGEIYEYKKPEDTLSSHKMNENSQQKQVTKDNFEQFGQRLQPTSFTKTPLFQDAQNTNHRTSLEGIATESQPKINPQFSSPNLQFSQNKLIQENQSNGNLNQIQPIQRASDNLNTIDRKQSIQNIQITPGPFAEKQSQSSNVPFGFSSRIRPCCQGSKISTLPDDARMNFQRPNQHSIQKQKENNMGSLAQLIPQAANFKPNLSKEDHVSSQFTRFQGQHGIQGTLTASQSFQVGVGEKFGVPRRPTSFDEASGYHY